MTCIIMDNSLMGTLVFLSLVTILETFNCNFDKVIIFAIHMWYSPIMLYIILDAVIDIWNETYIKLSILQLEILRRNNSSVK